VERHVRVKVLNWIDRVMEFLQCRHSDDGSRANMPGLTAPALRNR
jgi:hypothetical protein